MATEPLSLNDIRELLSQILYDPDKLRDIKDTAAYMGTTPGAVRALIKRGELNSLWIGNSEYVAQSAIHEWIERSHKAQENERYRRKLAAK